MFSLGAAWPRRLFLSTLYHLNLLRITSASGGRRMGDSCCGYKVTDQHSKLSTLRSSKRLTENMVVQLLGHNIDHKIPKCVSGLWGYRNLHSHKPWLVLLCYFNTIQSLKNYMMLYIRIIAWHSKILFFCSVYSVGLPTKSCLHLITVLKTNFVLIHTTLCHLILQLISWIYAMLRWIGQYYSISLLFF